MGIDSDEREALAVGPGGPGRVVVVGECDDGVPPRIAQFDRLADLMGLDAPTRALLRAPAHEHRLTLPVRLDEPLLRDIADATGGRYFRATDPEALNRIFRQIDQLEKTPVTVTRFTQFDEAYRIPLLVGLGALAIELLMAATAVVRVP